MSSPAFRAVVLGVLAAQWSATAVYDKSDYINIEDLPASGEAPVLLVQFLSASETLETIGTQGADGWREDGSFYLHLLMPTGEASTRALALGEQLRGLFRGQRFGAFVIESIDPFVDVDILGKWRRWSAPGNYYSIVCA